MCEHARPCVCVWMVWRIPCAFCVRATAWMENSKERNSCLETERLCDPETHTSSTVAPQCTVQTQPKKEWLYKESLVCENNNGLSLYLCIHLQKISGAHKKRKILYMYVFCLWLYSTVDSLLRVWFICTDQFFVPCRYSAHNTPFPHFGPFLVFWCPIHVLVLALGLHFPN